MSLLTLLRDSGVTATADEPRWATVTTPARPSWDEAIRASHKIATRATLLSNGAAVAELPIVDGSVSLDANAASRARVDLTLADDGTLDLVPDAPTSLLAPYGNEIKVERGIEYADGTIELVSLESSESTRPTSTIPGTT